MVIQKKRFFLIVRFAKSPSHLPHSTIFNFFRLQFFYTDSAFELCSVKVIVDLNLKMHYGKRGKVADSAEG